MSISAVGRSVKDIDEKIGTIGARVSDAASGVLQQASTVVEKVSDGADTAVTAAQEKGAAAAESVTDVATTLQAALVKSAKSQPLTTIGVAVAAGFVLGALWKTGR